MTRKLFVCLMLALGLVALPALVGCGDDDDDTTGGGGDAGDGGDTDTDTDTDTDSDTDTDTDTDADPLGDVFETLSGYVDDADIKPVIMADSVYNDIIVGGSEDYQIIDVRPEAHYAAAHLEGAINIPFDEDWTSSDVLSEIDSGLTQIVICHTGHRASYLTLYLRQLGYDAYAMMFGMMGWTTDIDNIGLDATFCTGGPGDWATVTDATDAVDDDLPELSNTTTGDELIKELAGDYFGDDWSSPVVKGSDIYDEVIVQGSEDYYLVDVRKSEHYEAGHLDGAVNLPYAGWVDESTLESVDSDKKVVTICYTGHAAAQIAMILNEVGYEAYAMAYGMMGWVSDTDIVGTTNVCPCTTDYPVVSE